MVCIPGRLAVLRVSDDNGTTWETYGGIVDVTMNVNVDELECTSHDSAGKREYIPNHDDVTLDVTGRWLDGDAGQDIVLTAVFGKTTFLFQFDMNGGAAGAGETGTKRYSGSAFATSVSPSGPLDDTGSMDVTFRCSTVVQSTIA